LEKIFDCLIDSFIKDKVGIAENFLSVSLATHLKDNLIGLFENKKLLNAGVGNDQVVNQNKLIRSDVIYWLDRKHNNQHENDFFDLMDEFVVYLNRTCYTGITGYEFHYTLYESGTFYKKHIDQFQNNGSRQYSMIMYLNSDWKVGDGESYAFTMLMRSRISRLITVKVFSLKVPTWHTRYYLPINRG